MNKSMLKNTFRSVTRTFSRFVAIMLIVATGFAFFAGIKAAGPDMLATAKKYYRDNNLMDLRIQSNIGLTLQDAQAIAEVEGVDYVMPQKFVDALVWVDGNVESDIDGSQISTRAYGINLQQLAEYATGEKNPAFINRPDLLSGRYPTAENECLVDESALSTPESFKLGSVITLGGDSDSIDIALKTTEFTIVGIVRSPYYISFERGNSLVGSGKIGTYIYIPDTAIAYDYYSEIYVTVQGAGEYEPYSDEYFEYVGKTADNISAISGQRLSVRAAQLNTTLPGQIASAQIQLNALTTESDLKFAEAEAKVKLLESLAANGDTILAQAQAEFNATFSEKSTQLSDRQNQYANNVGLLQQLEAYVAEAQKKWNANNAAYQASYAYFEEKNIQLANAGTAISSAENAVATTESLINTTKSVFNSLSATQGAALNQDDIQNIAGVLEAVNPELFNAVKSLTAQGMAVDAIALIRPQIEEYERQLAIQKDTLTEKREEYNKKETALNSAKEDLRKKETELQSAKVTLDGYTQKLEAAKQTLSSVGNQIQSGNYTLSLEQLKAQQQLATLQTQVENADANLEKAKKELEEAKKDVNEKKKYAETVINNGTNTLGKIATASWTVYDRNDTPGYSGFGEAAENVNTLANIFPVFFVLVASLVSLTTITRMVEDERTQIGTFKALGYTDMRIMSKYIIYSLLATVLGSVIGVAIGIYVFPYAINAAYGIMYELPPLIIGVPYVAVAVGFVIFCLMSVLLSYYVCSKELVVVPSVLMRAKAPKNGKRVFLEKIKPIWSKLSFTSKVTVRNTFRTPKRCIMTIAGIAGCTALLLAGLGMYDSVKAIMSNQYGENGISKYDMQIVFSEPQKTGQSSVLNTVARDSRIESAMLMSMTSLTGASERTSKKLDVYVLVPENIEQFKSMVDLRNNKNGELITLDDTGVVITEKFADYSKAAVGDTVDLVSTDGTVHTATVSAIVDNYIFDYAYMTPNVYMTVFGEAPSYHYAMANLTQDVKLADTNAAADGTVSAKAQLASDLMNKVGINAVAYSSDSVETFNEVVKAMSIVIALLIAAAALLEVIVLYNLANVNINERMREIATLKVVGFHDKEVSSYIYRENIILTVFGAVIGLIAGIFLHKLMIHFIVIDTVTYGKSITLISYAIALVATALLSVLVNLLMHRKLKKVGMVESFKSVE